MDVPCGEKQYLFSRERKERDHKHQDRYLLHAVPHDGTLTIRFDLNAQCYAEEASGLQLWERCRGG